ncbi:MAG: hypothetical protein DHS20C09_16640 [marine bacterium B5-7]|nr:MAG: hypothetical protein DHS20C09_16640 [marine bacterium B5-7]
MELAYKQGGFLTTFSKWTALIICLYFCAIGLKTFHHNQMHKITTTNTVSLQKASLITQMHNEMLLITRSHLQIMQASNEQQIREQLWRLSGLVSDYLIHYHELEQIIDNSDERVLRQFKTGFTQWYEFNKDLLSYANVVADSGFINTLNMIDLAFSKFDSNSEETLHLIAQLKKSSDNNEVSN